MPADGRARLRLVATAAAFAAALGAWFMLTRRADRAIAVRPGSTTRLTTDPGMELDPVLSPDGTTLAYSAGPPGRTRIRLRQLADGSTRRLTSGETTAAERWPQWSADGAQIVFQASPVPAASTAVAPRPQIYIVAAAGGSPRLLDTGGAHGGIAPSWFPQRPEIVFGGDGGIYTLTSSGDGAPHLIVPSSDAHSPRWSPDGRWLAYIERGAQFSFGADELGNVSASRLILHPAGSSAKISLTDGYALDTNPVWLPDSRSVLFISSRGGSRGNIYQLRVGPHGSSGEDPRRFKAGLFAHTMSIAPDGRRLLYSAFPPGASIWSVPLPAAGAASMAGATRLTFADEMIEKLALSPDGQTLAFDSNREGQFDVWTIPAAGGAARRITRSAEDEYVNDWSPDGRELVVHTLHEHQRDLLVIPADGSTSQPVVATPLAEHHAAWSPDGNRIVFDAPPKAGERVQAFIATRAGRGAPWQAPRQLTRHGSGDPKWSPDGRLIAFCVDYELRVIAPDGSGERTVFSGRTGPDLQEPNYPVWSRDSRTIYFKSYDRAGQSSIWSIALDGASPRLLIRFDDPAHRSLRREFATDGTRLYFTIARDESDIWMMELNR